MDSGGQASSPEEEPPRDPGLAKYHSYTNEDLEGHRAHSIYVGVHVPGARRRPRHRHHRHHHHHKSTSKDGSDNRPGECNDEKLFSNLLHLLQDAEAAE